MANIIEVSYNKADFLNSIRKLIAEGQWKYDNGFISGSYETLYVDVWDDIVKNYALNTKHIDKNYLSRKTHNYLKSAIKKKHDFEFITEQAINAKDEQITILRHYKNNNLLLARVYCKYKTPRGVDIMLYIKYALDKENHIVYVDQHYYEDFSTK